MSDALTFYALDVGTYFETRPSNGFVFCKVDGRIYEAYDGTELFEIEAVEDDFDVAVLSDERFGAWIAAIVDDVRASEVSDE